MDFSVDPDEPWELAKKPFGRITFSQKISQDSILFLLPPEILRYIVTNHIIPRSQIIHQKCGMYQRAKPKKKKEVQWTPKLYLEICTSLYEILISEFSFIDLTSL